METIEFTVRGDGANDIPRAVSGFPRNKRFDYAGDGFAVIVTEQYYFRTNSDLQTTTIFEKLDETTCRVTLVAGGGGAGLFGLADWGTEAGESHRLIGKFERYCEEHDLEIERE